MGKVEDGSTISDFDDEEIRRKISLYTSVIPIEYKDCKINFLDTPGFTDFVGDFWWAILLVVVVGIGIGIAVLGGAKGKPKRDRLLLRTPIIGSLVRVIAVERFTRVLSALSEAGVPLPDGINVASDATNNTIFQEAIADVREVLVRGGGLSQPLEDSGVFPLPALQMVRVGEKTGTLSTGRPELVDTECRRDDGIAAIDAATARAIASPESRPASASVESGPQSPMDSSTGVPVPAGPTTTGSQAARTRASAKALRTISGPMPRGSPNVTARRTRGVVTCG